MARNIGIGSLIIILIWSCSNNFIVPSEEYYPYKNAYSRIYEVIEINYQINNPKTEKRYYLKEQINSINKNDNVITFNIQRYKSTTTSNWKLDSIWTAIKTPDKLIIKENNVEFVKLTYPIIENAKWDINLFNTTKPLLATSSINNKKVNYGNIEISKSVVINISNDSSLVSLNKNKEVYGLNTGLLEKTIENFEYCQSTPDCIGKGIITFGNSKKVKLIAIETIN